MWVGVCVKALPCAKCISFKKLRAAQVICDIGFRLSAAFIRLLQLRFRGNHSEQLIPEGKPSCPRDDAVFLPLGHRCRLMHETLNSDSPAIKKALKSRCDPMTLATYRKMKVLKKQNKDQNATKKTSIYKQYLNKQTQNSLKVVVIWINLNASASVLENMQD